VRSAKHKASLSTVDDSEPRQLLRSGRGSMIPGLAR